MLCGAPFRKVLYGEVTRGTVRCVVVRLRYGLALRG